MKPSVLSWQARGPETDQRRAKASGGLQWQDEEREREREINRTFTKSGPVG